MFVVDGASVEEEGTDNALDAKDAGCIEGRTGWSVHCVLEFCSVVDFGMLVGGQDALEGRVVAPFGKDGGNVFTHCETTSAFIIGPGQIDTRVERAGPVLGDGAVFKEGVAKVVGIALADVFNAKIINY